MTSQEIKFQVVRFSVWLSSSHLYLS